MTRDVVVVVQARTGSSRFPGKVVADLAGMPMLGLQLQRMRAVPCGSLVVATTTEERDDVVVEVAAAAGVPTVRGSEDDVLDRLATAVDAYPAPTVVRVTADCPLMDPRLISDAVSLHRSSGADYTSNTLVRTFPDGLDVEVLRREALQDAAREARRPEEREHVTPFVYRHPRRFRLASLTCRDRLGHWRWTVDTAEDLAHVGQLLGRLDDVVGCDWHALAKSVPAADQPAPPLLQPLLPGDWSTDPRWRASADVPNPMWVGPPPARQREPWWFRSLVSGSSWVNDPGTPFTWVWAVGDRRAPTGWQAYATDGESEQIWGDVPSEAQEPVARAIGDLLRCELRLCRPPSLVGA